MPAPNVLFKSNLLVANILSTCRQPSKHHHRNLIGSSGNQRIFRRCFKVVNSRPDAGQSKQNTPSKVAPVVLVKEDRSRLRNIGIVAHINAGKTTTTERILYNAGSTDCVGDVDKGNTVTDYLVQERDRGITITSAAVTFEWNKHRINLIDTPGHVDFGIEVERSLSVLDGVVTIIDASAGVEAQTITVWNQAKKYQLPNIVFLNKYDKPQAEYKMCLKELESDLQMRANLIQVPIKTSPNEFSSLIDVIQRKLISWTNAEEKKGLKYKIEALDAGVSKRLDKKYIEQVEMERERLVNNLSDVDEDFASHVIECNRIGDVSGDLLAKSLRQAVVQCKLSPILIGSSFKYIGVQQLLDAIIDYLPSPIEREKQIRKLFNGKQVATEVQGKGDCALIFKIMHDKRLGALNYVRVFNGSISRLQRLQNLETGKLEQVKKIYRAFADELKDIDEPVCKDDIVVVTGLSETRTGDILIDQSSVASVECYQRNNQHVEQQTIKQLVDDTTNLLANHDANLTNIPPLQSNSGSGSGILSTSLAPATALISSTTILPFRLLNQHIIVPQINHMEPVYFCSIEALNVAHQLKFEQALGSMTREDPSFSYDIDSLGVTTIRGMGKLHLEVARDRIESEYGIKSVLGPLQIAYRESIDGAATEELSVSRLINSINNTLTIKLYVRPKPNAGAWTSKQLRLDTSGESSLGKLRNDHRKAIENGLMSGLMHGPTFGFPMVDCDILLLDFKANGRCGLPIIASAAGQCLMNAIHRCSPILLEPIMLLEVVAPSEHAGLILSDISARRGIVLSTQARLNGSMIIRSQTPLSMLSSYSEFVRNITSGRGSFSMELYNYVAMSESDKQTVARS